MNEPQLYAYLDYRKYLRDWFDWKKATNPRYSHRLFARRAGQRSPSYLLLVMDGKRNLGPSTTEAFARAIGLDEAGSQFFGHLVRLEQAQTPAERAAALDAILATQRFREARRLESEAFAYFTRWTFPAIHELSRRADFVADPAWIASTLVPSISVEEAAEALGALAELGLLEADEQGVPRPTDRAIVTPHEVLDVAFNHYHASMLERAREAIGRFPMEERHLLGITSAIPCSLVPEIKERLNEMQKMLLSACEQEPKERVYQLCIAFFPLSEGPGEP